MIDDTLPPTSAETEAVAIFEALVAEFGEWRARLANLESLLPEEPSPGLRVRGLRGALTARGRACLARD